ncbi:MAG TPA: 2Fe-2S iron-sulfur cluster-binding protein [Planctomycetota bacterium]|nr:2Fe-2S iron-sulfur cluster-binding protein [Planctomycetota bacterium]
MPDPPASPVYTPERDAPKPKRPFRITFLPMNKVVEVDPEQLPYGRDGLPGSILDVALAHGIEIEHACGGVCACSTCHVIVREGGETLCEKTEREEDYLDLAPGVTPQSRLGCRAVADGTRDLVVEVPNWNRNLAKSHG